MHHKSRLRLHCELEVAHRRRRSLKWEHAIIIVSATASLPYSVTEY